MFEKILKEYRIRNLLDSNRKNEVDYILWNKIAKFISFYPAKILYDFKIPADIITIFSFFIIICGGVFFLFGYLYLGISFIILFGLLDSIDGDVARLENEKKKYGSTIDSIGADIFYLIIPFCVSFYIFYYQKEFNYFVDIDFILIFGFSISSLIIFYRLISLRNYKVFNESKKLNTNKNKIKSNMNLKVINFILKNEIIRGNLFSEPGLISNLSILLYLNFFDYIYIYFLILFLYHFFRTAYLFIGTLYIYIKSKN